MSTQSMSTQGLKTLTARKGPVDTEASPYAKWRTLPLNAVAITGGFWQRWQETNQRVSLRHGFQQLEKSGNINNLLLAAGKGEGSYRTPVFMDSDVYKWLEAVGYELARHPDPELEQMADYAIGLIEAAQGEDGYLNSYWQVVEPERRWQDLQHGHELYCAGHLFQAAVAYYRGTGDDRLLKVSCRFADYIDSVFGPGKRAGTPGHPEIEMALVELYRATGERRYLDLALYFVDQRGRGLLGSHRLGSPAYYQDHVPVREATTVEGHAVRQLYLTTGLADLYLETGEQALMAALERQWHNMVSRKLHVTGGLGAQHAGEAFGEPYELPNDRAYCETCAQIASIMWNWRMLIITGERKYADLLELTLYNAFLSGVSLDGRRYFYVNPLLSRGKDPWLGRKRVERPEWHGCACCPPNVMRTLASLAHYLATADESGVQLHLYADAALDAEFSAGRRVALAMQADYPWSGEVNLTIQETDGRPWTLRLRVPGWCTGAKVAVNGAAVEVERGDGYAAITRAWQPGDRVQVSLPMTPELLVAHPRVDPTRGSVALRNGPLVYCLEQIDQEAGVNVEDVAVRPDGAMTVTWRPDLLGGVNTIQLDGVAVDAGGWEDSLYYPLGAQPDADGQPVKLTAIPYYAWANRGANAMRVWMPLAQGG
ncbi:MAG TPA: beta-L-arabinofuranosidase domain-containing protein [Caldilineaceae bacterium]|nr:beta-L-arabinofuranosidase domain-containing protein [Caldilineaceae bacterium]